MNQPEPKTYWHRLLGRLFELLFAAMPVSVKVDFNLMSEPPRSDVLLLRYEGVTWTIEQLARLPDGVRDSRAHHILLELKYTESLNKRRIEKAHAYDILYRETAGLSDKEVATFILSSKTPRQSLLDEFGYKPTKWPGVYRSTQPMVERVGLLVLNELRDEPHNAFVKCFASHVTEKQKAFRALMGMGRAILPTSLWMFLVGLRRTMLGKGDEEMRVITPDDVMAIGKQMRDVLLASTPLEERLKGFDSEEVLEVLLRYKPEEVLSRYKPEEVLSRYKPEEVLSLYKPEEVLSRYKPEEVLSRYKPEEVLSRYKPYLEERDHQATLKRVEQTLKLRFKVAEDRLKQFDERLQKLNSATMEQLYEVAIMADSLADFETKLSMLEPADVAEK